MKKVSIGLAIGWVIGIASTIIGLNGYANDPLIAEYSPVNLPSIWKLIELALKGSGFLLIVVTIIYGITYFIFGFYIMKKVENKDK